jgi:hypothetical protein
MEWHTDCGVVEDIDPSDPGEYELGDWEPCVHCDDNDCVARICLADDRE